MPTNPDRLSHPCQRFRVWLRRIGALVGLATILLANGAHTLATQSYGWLQMFNAYNETFSLSTSLEMTFSGEELCGICVLSQDSLEELENNLSLALNGQKSRLAPSEFAPLSIAAPSSARQPHFQTRPAIYYEIKSEFDPPPPRLA